MLGVATVVLSGLKAFLGFVQQRSADAKNAAIQQAKENRANRDTSASLIKTAMAHKVFWVAWGLFAIPLGAWWSLVVIDSMIPAHILNLQVPDLPDSIKPWAQQIFDNIFLSGATVGGVQIASRAATTIATVWNQSRSDKRDILK